MLLLVVLMRRWLVSLVCLFVGDLGWQLAGFVFLVILDIVVFCVGCGGLHWLRFVDIYCVFDWFGVGLLVELGWPDHIGFRFYGLCVWFGWCLLRFWF